MKKIIGKIMAWVCVLSLCSMTAMAAGDIVLNGDANGESSLIGVFEGAGGEYSYLGFATFNGVTEDYKYLELTYKGDISTLRLELVKADESFVGPYWFDSSQVMSFKTADGSAIETTVDEETTIIIDLEASGIDFIGDCIGTHMHYLSPEVQSATFEIVDAKFTSGVMAIAETEEAATDDAAAETGFAVLPTAAACLVLVGASAGLVSTRKKES